MGTILEENILNKECVIDDDYGPQVIDNSLISIDLNYVQEGEIFILTVFKGLDTEVFATVKESDLEIMGINEVEMAFSNKDDSMCVKILKDFLPSKDFSVLVSTESHKKTILVILPKKYV